MKYLSLIAAVMFLVANCWPPDMIGMPPCTAKHGQYRLMVAGSRVKDFPDFWSCKQAADNAASVGLLAFCGPLN